MFYTHHSYHTSEIYSLAKKLPLMKRKEKKRKRENAKTQTVGKLSLYRFVNSLAAKLTILLEFPLS